MSQPTPYVRQFDFTGWSTSRPNTPHPGVQIDAELNAVRAALNHALTNLALIQRDDTGLANGVVGIDQLSAVVQAMLAGGGFTVRGNWAASTAYLRGDVVADDGKVYLVITDHNSSASLPADIASGYVSSAIFEPHALLDYMDDLAAATGAGLVGSTGGITVQAALNLKAALASPTFTGTPTAPTAALGTDTTQIATTAFVQDAVQALLDAAPGTLDTLNELAAALGDDANFAATTATSLSARVQYRTSRANLAAAATTPATAFLTESGREGVFVWSSGNHATDVTNDPEQGVYVAPSSAPTGASGAWVRRFFGPVMSGWFGAVATGSAILTTKIQAMLNFASYSGIRHALLQDNGLDYIVDAGLSIPNGVTFEALGRARIKLKDNCSPLPSSIIGNSATNGARHSGVKLRGLRVDGNRQNNINHGTPDGNGNQAQGWEGLPVAAISLAYIDDVEVSGCEVTECWASAIWLVDCTDEKVVNNRVTAYRKSGISVRRIVPTVSPGATTYRITGNYTAGGIVGIHTIFGTAQGIIQSNICLDNRDENGFPAWAWDGTYPNVWPSTGGFVDSGDGGYVSPVNPGDGAGIEHTGYHTVAGAAKEEEILINGNICRLNQIGIRIEQEGNKLVATGNICTENYKHGFYGYSVYDILIGDNLLSKNGEHGVSIEHAPSQAANVYVQIVGNQISRNDLFGIALENCDSSLITGNMLLDNGQDSGTAQRGAIGIYKDNTTSQLCDRVSIRGNWINQTGGYWVYYDDTGHSNMKIIDNEFYGTPTAKMNNVNLTNSEVRGNTGIVTRNKGSSSVAANSFVAVTHGLDFTPNVANIRVNFIEDIAADGRSYLSPTPGSTTFDVILAGSSGTKSFTWSIDDH